MPEEMSRGTEIAKRKEFDDAIKAKFSDSLLLWARQRKVVKDAVNFEFPFDEID